MYFFITLHHNITTDLQFRFQAFDLLFPFILSYGVTGEITVETFFHVYKLYVTIVHNSIYCRLAKECTSRSINYKHLTRVNIVISFQVFCF